jgi:ADP-heptose:LPS heptosyltransferase
MKAGILKNLDYWCGIPLCFIISVFCRIQSSFSTKNSLKKKISKILFLEMTEIGSVILAYPAMKKAAEMYPEAKLYFLIFSENQDIIHLLNIIPKKNIVTLRSKSPWGFFIDTLKVITIMRREEIDVVIDMELFSRFASALSYLSGAKKRVGFYRYKLEGLYLGNLFTHKVLYNPYLHISKNFMNLVDCLNESLDDYPLLKKIIADDKGRLPEMNISKHEQERIAGLLKNVDRTFNINSRIVIVHYGFNDKISVRRWPADYYSELIKRIISENDVSVVLIGGSHLGVNFDSANGRRINFIGKTTVKDLIGIFNLSRVLVSHDCGIIHIASLTKIHIVGIFGPESPILYSPLTGNKKILYKNFACSPCLSAYNFRNSVCINNKCMQAISVEEVYNEVIKAI